MSRLEARKAGRNLSIDCVEGEDRRNLTLEGSDSTLPRVDTVVKVGGRYAVAVGTPAEGATLRNRRGAGMVPPQGELIGWVLVYPSAVAISDAHISEAWIERRLAELEAEISP